MVGRSVLFAGSAWCAEEGHIDLPEENYMVVAMIDDDNDREQTGYLAISVPAVQTCGGSRRFLITLDAWEEYQYKRLLQVGRPVAGCENHSIGDR